MYPIKTNIKATLLRHTSSPYDSGEIITMEVVLPRFLLAEMNTHRMFSRNAASSRAIPFNKMVSSAMDNPFVPAFWQKKHKGMQGKDYFPYSHTKPFIRAWLNSRNNAVATATKLHNFGVTKQLCNRLLEPYIYTTMLITTMREGLDNFFMLRCPHYHFRGEKYRSYQSIPPHKRQRIAHITALKNKNSGAAEVHMQLVAEAMYDAVRESTPQHSDIHNPYHVGSDSHSLRRSVVRAAHISYTAGPDTFDDENTKLYNTLLRERHMSPFEHIAFSREGAYSNLHGFISLRHAIENKMLPQQYEDLYT